MFNAFLSAFPPGRNFEGSARRLPKGFSSPAFDQLQDHWVGSEFGGGLYRLHTDESGRRMDEIVQESVPGAGRHAFIFGYDWLGRQYGFRLDPESNGEPMCRVFDPAACEAFDVPGGVEDLHNVHLPDMREDVLRESLFIQFRDRAGIEGWIPEGRCMGLKVPALLGGQENLDNLEESDLEVYWHFAGQVSAQVSDLPEGTPIGSVSIEEN